jgi:formaldehyde-activating enzyme involved in methanogenesis
MIMQRKSAKKAIKDVLEVELTEREAQELYLNICNYLLNNDDKSYISVIRYKYLLLCDEISTTVSDYLVMEQLLEKMREKHPLILSALTYIATYKN